MAASSDPTNGGRDCAQHGRLATNCSECSKDDEIAELQARLWQVDTGCFNCGGLPHTDTCQVRDTKALLARAELAEWRADGLRRILDGVINALEPQYGDDEAGIVDHLVERLRRHNVLREAVRDVLGGKFGPTGLPAMARLNEGMIGRKP